MCGFAGFLSPENVIGNSKDVLLSMGDSISHRGPDSSGVWLSDDETIGMSHRRLAIVDLSDAGHQPMLSKSGQLVLSFNGEIYNHPEIRNLIDREKHIEWRGYSDTETLIEAFELWGLESTLKKIKGMFSFALWDSLKEELILGRDRLGEKPLYYGYCNGSMIFGSELKALTRFPGFNKKINKAVLPIYLEKLCIPAPYSIFENIYCRLLTFQTA